ncbi:XdhC family protein [Rhabdothermincola sediminis]|uniref:XdhC family protein n=1 Tax=Rhabdothermincola sediminis TaxID=2751370 RepID=UPI0027D9FBFE|nr:XdhC family protein [Rhabdothermincola sediminis]
MRGLTGELARWRAQGLRVALVRVVEVDGSGPRLPGAAMAVSERGDVAGAVSGGCVEAAAVEEARRVLEDGQPRLVSFGYSDDEVFAVGLTCGGTIRVFIEVVDWSLVGRLAGALDQGGAVAMVTVVDGRGRGSSIVVTPDAVHGSLGDPDLDRVVARDARGELAAGRSVVRHYGEHGEARESAITVFIDAHTPRPRMVVIGAVDFTAALVAQAKLLGYHVTVCDPREVFATRERFPQADDVVVDWPDRLLDRLGAELGPRDAICVLTHDHKFDVPAIVAALGTEVGYLGAMGSRRTHAERVERLRAAGVRAEQLSRLMAPIGLDLGARTPEETAVAICAEIIAARTGAAVPSLRDGEGPIHR